MSTTRRPLPSLAAFALSALLAALPEYVNAGAQQEEALSANVQASLHRAVSDFPSAQLNFANAAEGDAWIKEMGQRLANETHGDAYALVRELNRDFPLAPFSNGSH